MWKKILLYPFYAIKNEVSQNKDIVTTNTELLKGTKELIKNSGKDVFGENSTFKEGRALYESIHGASPCLNADDIFLRQQYARIVSGMLGIYMLFGLYFFDIVSIFFGVMLYTIIVVFYLQYMVWANKYRCLVPIKLFFKQTWREKKMWIWYINYYKEK